MRKKLPLSQLERVAYTRNQDKGILTRLTGNGGVDGGDEGGGVVAQVLRWWGWLHVMPGTPILE